MDHLNKGCSPAAWVLLPLFGASLLRACATVPVNAPLARSLTRAEINRDRQLPSRRSPTHISAQIQTSPTSNLQLTALPRLERSHSDKSQDIDRARVYEVTGYDENERSLRRFTVPMRSVCDELKAAGRLAADAPVLLEVHYADSSGRPQPASGFVGPDEIALLFGAVPAGRPAQGTDEQRGSASPADQSIEGFTTEKSRNVRLDEACVKYQHSLDVSRQRGRQIHLTRRLTLAEAKTDGKGTVRIADGELN
jgi:hypothetical protein